MKFIASPRKIGFHKEKLKEYLEGNPVFPVTLELDITSACTMNCKDCPSSRSPFQKSLSFGFIEKLFNSFQGQTHGLLLTGGEPTMSPMFPAVLKLAREKGFRNIAVVTNGTLLDKPEVMDALVRYVSTIRISLYHWDEGYSGDLETILKKIAKLRKHIVESDSELQIGIGALTSKKRLNKLPAITDWVRDAGADWIYFHPMCFGWGDAHLEQYDQQGVTDIIQQLQQKNFNGFEVYFSGSRYEHTALNFSAYHAAHFLMIVGADGLNYLGAEVKYQPDFIIADLNQDLSEGYLQRSERLERISHFSSRNYSALNSRHRGVLYNHYVEELRNGGPIQTAADPLEKAEVRFPHIL
jgi:MoaA/NifB/PqqE/SkfB family radical SAM enzyme